MNIVAGTQCAAQGVAGLGGRGHSIILGSGLLRQPNVFGAEGDRFDVNQEDGRPPRQGGGRPARMSTTTLGDQTASASGSPHLNDSSAAMSARSVIPDC